MMMMPDRKKAVTVIVAGLGGGDDMGGMMGEDSNEYARKECARMLMESIKRSDVDGFCEFMSDFIDMCKEKSKPMEMDEY